MRSGDFLRDFQFPADQWRRVYRVQRTIYGISKFLLIFDDMSTTVYKMVANNVTYNG